MRDPGAGAEVRREEADRAAYGPTTRVDVDDMRCLPTGKVRATGKLLRQRTPTGETGHPTAPDASPGPYAGSR